MATQKDLDKKSQQQESEEEFDDELEKAVAETQKFKSRAKEEEKAKLKAEKELAKSEKALASVQAELEQERQTRQEVEQALDTAQWEVEQERQARIKAEENIEQIDKNISGLEEDLERERSDRRKAEQDLVETENSLSFLEQALERERQVRIEAEKAETAQLQPDSEKSFPKQAEIEPGELEEDLGEISSGERRLAFVVRLVVDSQGRTRRSEIEHIQSKKKMVSSTLDAAQLAAFMEANLGTTDSEETVVAAKPAPLPTKADQPQSLSQRTYLEIKNVGTYPKGDLGSPSMVVDAKKEMEIRVDLHLRGPEALQLSERQDKYEVKVYARKVTNGESTVLATFRDHFLKGMVDYSVKLISAKLEPGVYRLLTLAILDSPKQLAAHFDGPAVQVMGLEQSTAEILATSLE
jgi:hypothetical protein